MITGRVEVKRCSSQVEISDQYDEPCSGRNPENFWKPWKEIHDCLLHVGCFWSSTGFSTFSSLFCDSAFSLPSCASMFRVLVLCTRLANPPENGLVRSRL